jgi:hypothetical protein
MVLVALVYLFVALIINVAYNSAISAWGLVWHWRSPDKILWCCPALVLLMLSPFVSRRRWAARFAFVLFMLNLIAVLCLLGLLVTYWLTLGPASAIRTLIFYMLVLGAWVAWLVALLVRLRSQLQWMAANPRYSDKSQHVEGFCRICSYNLTGNVSGICPECGTPIDRKCESATAR